MLGIPVKAEGFEHLMGVVQNRTAGGFINTAGFHTDQTVFDHIIKTDAVSAAQLVEFHNNGSGRHFFAVDRYRFAFFKGNGYIFRLIGRLLGGYTKLQKAGFVVLGLVGGVFQIQSLMRKVPQVLILGIVGFPVDFQRDMMGFRIFDFLFTGFDIPFAPGGDNLHIRRKGFNRQLEPHLVVALAGAAVANGVRALCQRDFYNALGNNRAGKRRTQQIPLVSSARF